MPTARPPDRRTRRRLTGLAAAYGLLWVGLAIDPVNRLDWLLENLLVAAALAFLAATYRRLRLSAFSYILIATFLSLHAVGAHYTYSEAPPGFWLQRALDLDRNHFDRLVHFSFGLLLARPFLEVGERHGAMQPGWAYTYAFLIVAATSALYELLEWIVAMIVSPDAAMAWLGTQGDPFDAQKDTGLATIGAALALGLVAVRRRAARPL